MRFPLVSRRAFDEIVVLAKEMAAALTAERNAERVEVRRLTDLLVEMRRDGFNAPAPVVPQPAPPEPLAEPIREALSYLAREGYTGDELGQEEAQARRLLAQGLEPAQVARMLVQGDPSVTL